MDKWTEEDVVCFIRRIDGIPDYSLSFSANNIDGALLMKLTRTTLKQELEIWSLGHRDKILRVGVLSLMN